MTRPLRIEYPGAVYHIMSRGNGKQTIFLDSYDRLTFLDILTVVGSQYNWLCHSYCLMNNHYHLLIETLDPTLSSGMRQLNGVYSQRFNRRHDRVGHLLQGRYKSILVEKGEYLVELCRYIVLNPVRAGLVKLPEEWIWSSYRSILGLDKNTIFLTREWILSQFGKSMPEAQSRYQNYVTAGLTDIDKPWERVKGQLVFGGELFHFDIREKLTESQNIREIKRAQRFAARPSLSSLLPPHITGHKMLRNRVMATAHTDHGYTIKEIADELGLHYTTVSKAIKKSNNSRPDPG